MKKMMVLSLVFTMLLASCSATKAVREKRDVINGTWTLNDVSYTDQDGTFKSVIFNDAQDICFEGSTWFFRDNNSTGSYTIAPSSLCTGGERFIRWSVIEEESGLNKLQFKMIDEKKNDISGGLGYRLDIENLTESTMTLKSRVTANGSPVSVVYKFTKQQ